MNNWDSEEKKGIDGWSVVIAMVLGGVLVLGIIGALSS